jgi:hypothetical protein
MRSSWTGATSAPMSIALSSGVADAQRLHARAQLATKRRRRSAPAQQARAGAADLALVEPDRVDHALDGAVEVGVVEDDEGALAAELERGPCRCRRSPADARPTSVEPVKAILSTPGWSTSACAGAAVAGDDVEHARRQAGLVGELGEERAR